MIECLKMLFPQWQGSGLEKDLYYGAIEIRDHLLPKDSYKQIGVSVDEELTIKNNIILYDSITTQLQKAIDTISGHNPQKIFTIGGDCGVEIAPVSYLNRYYNGDLAVIWFDAHGDLNTPGSSPSKNFHGMPLRCLLGEGDIDIVEKCFSILNPNQVILAGCRELDKPEEEYIHRKNILVLKVNDFEKMLEMIKANGYKNLYIHLDLDVIDPKCFPAVMCPTENGINFESIMRYLYVLKKAMNVVGMSVVEYKQIGNNNNEKLKGIIEFGYSI